MAGGGFAKTKTQSGAGVLANVRLLAAAVCASAGRRITQACQLVGGARVASGAGDDEFLTRGVAETLKLVLRSAEPACAALHGGDATLTSMLETLKLVLRTAKPARALLDVGVLGGYAKTLELVL